MSDARQYAPATQRNRAFILQVLQQILPATGSVLEIASGTGEHATFFAQKFPRLSWLPSDLNPIAQASINAWRLSLDLPNLYPAIALNVEAPHWVVEQTPLPPPWQALDLRQHPIQTILNINMIHIAPWSACLSLMAGAGRILPRGGILYLYGPFQRDGKHTALSNESFDLSLRSQNPTWGVRHLEEVVATAAIHGLLYPKIYEMPANNLSVVFAKA